jgi:hypothetical protein
MRGSGRHVGGLSRLLVGAAVLVGCGGPSESDGGEGPHVEVEGEVSEPTKAVDRGPMEISADITIDGEPIGRGSRSMSCESVMLDLPDAGERGQHERHLRIEPDDEGRTATIRLEMPFREGEHSEVEDDGIRRMAVDVDTIEVEPRRIHGTATLEPEFGEFNNATPVEITFDIRCGYRGE